jgi:hypothetical protein
MVWLGVLKLVLTIAASLAGWLRNNQLMDAGASQQIAKQLAEVARQGGLSQQIRDEVANMTDPALDAELQGKDP